MTLAIGSLNDLKSKHKDLLNEMYLYKILTYNKILKDI